MKRILQLDGGGCKGIMQLIWLHHIEKNTGKKIFELFDLIVGTSIGAINGSLMASGKVSASMLYHDMVINLPKIFSRRLRIPIIQPMYDRKIPTDLLSRYIGNIPMHRLKTNFMSTSVNICENKTYYFKSWKDKWKDSKVIDIVNKSYAAPLYFGQINDPANKSCWIDGGCGNQNCSLLESMIQTIRNNWWPDHNIYILSLGTGKLKERISYNKAKNFKNIRQVAEFASPLEGGMAREQSINSQVEIAHLLDENFPKFNCQRIDPHIEKKIDKLDGIKYIQKYRLIAEKHSDTINLKPFLEE